MEKVLIFAFGLVALGAAFHFSEDSLKYVDNFADFSSINDQSWLEGKSRLLSLIKADTVCKGIYSCADCNTTRICRPDGKGGFTPVQSVPCPQSLPYCDYETGTCTNEPEKSCGQQDNFICLGDGHYPDDDCTIYHVCSGLVSSKFKCEAPGELYNADKKICEKTLKCGRFLCQGGIGQKVPNTEYPQYFGFCQNDMSVAVIDRCPGSYQLNETSQKCEPVCLQEGVIQDLDNCTRYFKCQSEWFNGVKYLSMVGQACPDGTAYDPKSYICVSINQHPDPKCRDSRPTLPPGPPTITTPGPTTKPTPPTTKPTPPTTKPTTPPTTPPTTKPPTPPTTTKKK